MSDFWNPHDVPPDPWLTPTWEDPEFIAEDSKEEQRKKKSQWEGSATPTTVGAPTAAEMAALAHAEATLGELRGALAVVPTPIASGVIKRLFFKEAAAYLHVAATWVHPADLALRSVGATSGVLAAIRSGRPRAALPVTFASAAMLPTDEDDEWARTLDRHAENGILLARTLARMALSSLGRTSAPSPWERLNPTGTPDDNTGPFGVNSLWPQFHATLKSEDPSHKGRDLSSLHALGRRWGGIETHYGDADADALARLCLCLGAFFNRDRPGPWLLPWLCKLPQRYRRTTEAVALFVDAPQKRMAWFDAAREGALEGLATLSALRQSLEVAEQADDIRSTPLLKKIVDLALSDAVITTGSAAKACHVAPASAFSVLTRLEKVGMLREITGRDRYRVWSCGF